MAIISIEGPPVKWAPLAHPSPFLYKDKMASSEEVIIDGIKSILKTPERDFVKNPLQQEEIMAIVETLCGEVNDPTIDEDVAQYFLAVIEFLKKKVLYN